MSFRQVVSDADNKQHRMWLHPQGIYDAYSMHEVIYVTLAFAHRYDFEQTYRRPMVIGPVWSRLTGLSWSFGLPSGHTSLFQALSLRPRLFGRLTSCTSIRRVQTYARENRLRSTYRHNSPSCPPKQGRFGWTRVDCTIARRGCS